jgi:hypothetical protein
MPRTKESKRRNIFLYQGGHALLVYAFGVDAAGVIKSPNRFLRQFRESNRRRAA